MDALGFILIGIVGGIVGGMFGIGGGVVILPALIFLKGYSQKMAQGTSLVALLAPVGLLGLINYYKDNNADLRGGGLIAAGFFGGAFVGSKIAIGLDDGLLRKGFSVFLVVVAIQIWFKS